MDTSSGELTVRQAGPTDVDDIIGLVRDSFPSEVVRASIYGSATVSRYIARQLEVPWALAPSRFFVMAIKGQVAGSVELLCLANMLFVSYISVAREWRGRGFGSQLLHDSIAGVAVSGQTEIRLDVLDGNVVARDWYERLGFRLIESSDWWTFPLPACEKEPPYIIQGWAQAEACHDAYGFSQFTMEVGKKVVSVGRLADALFRITNPELIGDPRVWRTLQLLEPHRRVLVIGSHHGQAAERLGAPALRMNRMAAPLRDVVERLGNQ